MTVDERLDPCKTLTLLKSYKPRNRKSKRRFKSQRRTIVARLKNGFATSHSTM